MGQGGQGGPVREGDAVGWARLDPVAQARISAVSLRGPQVLAGYCSAARAVRRHRHRVSDGCWSL